MSSFLMEFLLSDNIARQVALIRTLSLRRPIEANRVIRAFSAQMLPRYSQVMEEGLRLYEHREEGSRGHKY